MILSFSMTDLIGVPFGYVMDLLYRITQNYGAAVMAFAIMVSFIMYPINIKSRVNAVKRTRLEPKVKQIREMFPGNLKAQNTLMEKMYERENVNLAAGCLLSIIPFFMLIALFSVVSHPLVYVSHESKDVVNGVIQSIFSKDPAIFTSKYSEIIVSQHIASFAEALRAEFPGLSEAALRGINYNFLGIDLAAVPQLDFTQWETFDWAHIGLFILPFLPVCTRVIPFAVGKVKMLYATIKRKKAGTYVTPVKTKPMNMLMPVLMLMFVIACFQVPGAIALYWFTKSVADLILGRFVNKKIAAIPANSISVEELVEEYYKENPDEQKADNHTDDTASHVEGDANEDNNSASVVVGESVSCACSDPEGYAQATTRTCGENGYRSYTNE